jgi:hypothetical protein
MRALLLWLSLVPATALARPVTVEGTVVGTASRWTRDGSRIVTEATVRTADGDVKVSQLGGTVDGLTMRTFPGPELLAPGMRVAVAATERLDGSHRMHVAVDSVRVLYMPPHFVRTGPTKAGNFLFWESGCVYVRASREGTKYIAGEREHEIIAAAIQMWNDKTASCSYMNMVLEPPLETEEEVGRDRVNLIKFRDISWCRPALDDDPPRCHADSAAGLTTAVFVDDERSDRDGAIVDADIELNGVNFAVADNGQTTSTSACKSELQNTLTHELGHLLGLEHPCRTLNDPERVDGDGDAVPLCSSALGNQAITEATMYNFQECGEMKKETLEADDIDALCKIYPAGEDPGTCDPVGTRAGCCSAADTGLPLGPLLGGLGFGVLLLRRRRSAAPPARRA